MMNEQEDSLDEEEAVDRLSDTAAEMKAIEGLQDDALYTDDPEAALMGPDETFTYYINTGKQDVDGRPIKQKVECVDTHRPDQAVNTMFKQGDEHDESVFQLVQTHVVEPDIFLIDAVGEQKARDNWSKATAAFKRGLYYQLLRMNGVDGDFFDQYARFVPKSTIRQLQESYTESQEPTESGPQAESSETSETPTPRQPSETSTSRTTTSSKRASTSGSEASQTEPSQPPQDSEGKKPHNE